MTKVNENTTVKIIDYYPVSLERKTLEGFIGLVKETVEGTTKKVEIISGKWFYSFINKFQIKLGYSILVDKSTGGMDELVHFLQECYRAYKVFLIRYEGEEKILHGVSVSPAADLYMEYSHLRSLISTVRLMGLKEYQYCSVTPRVPDALNGYLSSQNPVHPMTAMRTIDITEGSTDYAALPTMPIGEVRIDLGEGSILLETAEGSRVPELIVGDYSTPPTPRVFLNSSEIGDRYKDHDFKDYYLRVFFVDSENGDKTEWMYIYSDKGMEAFLKVLDHYSELSIIVQTVSTLTGLVKDTQGYRVPERDISKPGIAYHVVDLNGATATSMGSEKFILRVEDKLDMSVNDEVVIYSVEYIDRQCEKVRVKNTHLLLPGSYSISSVSSFIYDTYSDYSLYVLAYVKSGTLRDLELICIRPASDMYIYEYHLRQILPYLHSKGLKEYRYDRRASLPLISIDRGTVCEDVDALMQTIGRVDLHQAQGGPFPLPTKQIGLVFMNLKRMYPSQPRDLRISTDRQFPAVLMMPTDQRDRFKVPQEDIYHWDNISAISGQRLSPENSVYLSVFEETGNKGDVTPLCKIYTQQGLEVFKHLYRTSNKVISILVIDALTHSLKKATLYSADGSKVTVKEDNDVVQSNQVGVPITVALSTMATMVMAGNTIKISYTNEEKAQVIRTFSKEDEYHGLFFYLESKLTVSSDLARLMHGTVTISVQNASKNQNILKLQVDTKHGINRGTYRKNVLPILSLFNSIGTQADKPIAEYLAVF